MNRYSRNMKMLTREENDNLKNSKVCVVGCGGRGCNTFGVLQLTK